MAAVARQATVRGRAVKFLLAEYWQFHIYAEPFSQRLRELGHQVVPFRELEFFQTQGPLARVRRIARRAEYRLAIGPAVRRLNRALLALARAERPDVVFLFRGSHVFPRTLQELRRAGAYVIGWQNDDPFGRWHAPYLWRHFLRGIPYYDLLFAYRESNVGAFLSRGCPRAEVLRSFYIRELNRPVLDPVPPELCSDVCFAGHWEPDGRDEYVSLLLDSHDIDFKLWGGLWERSNCAHKFGSRAVRPILKDQYNFALNGAKIAIAFLSKLNNDTYTRRCFEIPAAGTFMLSEYTDDLAAMFEPGRDAEYFRSPVEMMDKIRFYIRNESARRRIAAAGHQRVTRDGHEALDRAKQVVRAVETYAPGHKTASLGGFQ
jgi:hypothetical protein